MKRATVAVATVALGAAGLGAAALNPATGAPDRTHAIKFGVPRIVDPIHTYGEPDIKVAPNGTIHVSGPQGTGVQRSIWNASYDNGDSFRLVQDNKTGSAPISAMQPTKSTMGPGGGDTEIAIDRHSNAYYADLYALTCYTTGYSDDDGKNVQSTPLGCSSPGADRQWMGIYDPAPSDHTISPYKGPKPIVYMKYSALTAGSKIDYTTGDDPTNWHQNDPAAVIAADDPYSPTNAPIVVDQHTGDVLTAVMMGDDGGMALSIGQPAKDGSAKLDVRYEPIIPAMKGDPNTLFQGVAEDKARNLYVVWVQGPNSDDEGADYQVYYSWAAPKGNDWGKWSKPVRINRPPSATNLMPWVEAGSNGIIDVVWYGTDMTLEQLGDDGPSAQKHESWYAWFAQIDHAASAHPHIVQSRASQHPMKYNDICMLGTGCITATGNRNLADFFEVAIDGDGRARIVFPDTSNGLANEMGAVEQGDHPGAALDTIATQQTGLNAWTGKPLKPQESQAPTNVITDASGDARYPVLGGGKVAGADIERITLDRTSKALRVSVTLAHGTLADAAAAANARYGRLVVRWQMGNTLYHAGVDQDAGGGSPTYYAGATQSTDSCSVSACNPHTLDYVAPPLPGAAAATGTAKVGQTTTYTINVPLSAVGNPKAGSLLEEVAGYVFAAAFPGSEKDSKAQTDADQVPLELEGTKTINYRANASGSSKSAALVPGAVLLLPLLAMAARRRRRS